MAAAIAAVDHHRKIQGTRFGADYPGGAFVGKHGSWNRRPLSGYKVIFVPFVEGKPLGPPQDTLAGFVNGMAKHSADGSVWQLRR